MTIRVAVPVLFGSLRLHVEKGRQWNPIEHSLLCAVCQRPQSAHVLSGLGNLPWRVVIEVMIRLMRAGWVEMLASGGEVMFQGTLSGKSAAEREVLPAVTRLLTRRASFTVDRITGSVFRAREFSTLYHRPRLEKLQSTGVVVMPSAGELPTFPPDVVIRTLLDEDEQCKAIDPSASRPVDRWAIVSVIGTTIEGLPSRAPEDLYASILAAAKSAKSTIESATVVQPAPPIARVTPNRLETSFDFNDLVIGGLEHRVLFERVLKTAASWLVIHSTFVSVDRFKAVLPLLKSAAKRGARIDVLWGMSSTENGRNATQEAVAACRDLLVEEYAQERIRLHTQSTGSHSKLLLSDNGRGQMIAIVGSCNWLNSSFEGFEVSATFRDPSMVAALTGQLSALAVSPNGHWPPLARELAALSSSIRTELAKKIGVSARASIVLGADHGRYVRVARDSAQRRIVCGSHKFSHVADTLVLTPAKAAMKDKNISVTLYYGSIAGAKSGGTAVEMVQHAKEAQIGVTQVLDPRMHAKFLIWDDDDVVITSQNWLSADPPDHSHLSEIGVHINAKGIGRELAARVAMTLENKFQE